ncbi:MAG: S1 RNA-binding domain-containing protein [bacterium]|nr:S1 RNA-binding domain-containing protein [Candidatus Sumerlaeota bacterium]
MFADEISSDDKRPSEGVLADEDQQFEHLISSYLGSVAKLEIGQLAHARVVEVKKDYVLLDIGDKAEGIVDIKEFADYKGNLSIAAGDEVDVVIRGRDSETGQVEVSYKLARQRLEWDHIVKAYEEKRPVTGCIVKALKTGVLVDVGMLCFCPASQLDTVPVPNIESMVGQEIQAYVIDLDENRRRGVLSRRKLMTEEAKKKRHEVLESLTVDQAVTGKVKSIVDFGVFVDLGGLDGLVPREEVSWERHFDVTDVLKVGYNYKFKVMTVDRVRERVSLSRRQLKPDPWLKVAQDYPADKIVKGTVTNLSPNCAYVALEDGMEGRIHRDNLSWALTIRKPSDVLKKGDAVKAVVIGYDNEKRLLDLGLKQISADPWSEIEQKYPVDSRLKVKVAEIVSYGAFVHLDENTKGLIHITDFSYERGFKDPTKFLNVGDEIEAVVLRIDHQSHRINLGIKQLEDDPFESFTRSHPVGSSATGMVKNIADFGVFVELAPHVEGMIHKTQWSKQKVDSLDGAVKPGETVTAKVIKIEPDKKKISLSRRAYLADEERCQIDEYRNTPTDATTSLGSLLKKLKIDVQ